MSIFKPNNSTNYHYRFMAGGKIKTGSTHTANKANAVKFEARMKEEVYAQQYLNAADNDHITVEDAIEQYFKDNKHRTLPKTYHVFRHKTLGTMTNNRTGKKQRVFGMRGADWINELRTRDIQALITARFGENNSAGTIIYELVFIAQVFKHAKRMGFIVPDIDFKELKSGNKLKPSKGRNRYYTKEEEDAIERELSINLANDTPITKMQRLDGLHLMYCLADTGARYTEAASLKWESIDLDSRMIRLYRPKVKNESLLMMSDRLYEVLKERHSVKADDAIYVFEGRNGKHVTSGRKAFKSACERAGVTDATFHTFRHTFASKIVQAGGSLYDAQQLLGHTSSATTERYAHLIPQQSALKAQQIINNINAGK